MLNVALSCYDSLHSYPTNVINLRETSKSKAH